MPRKVFEIFGIRILLSVNAKKKFFESCRIQISLRIYDIESFLKVAEYGYHYVVMRK